MTDIKNNTTTPEILGCITKYENNQSSIFLYVIIVMVASFYSICIIKLKYLPLSPLGIYGGILALVTLLIGLYGYTQYVLMLVLLHDIHNRGDFSSIKFPGHQKWYTMINKLSYLISKFFLVFGVLYIIEYYLLIPPKAITIENWSLKINTENNSAFVFSWVSIMFLIVFAFPTLVLIRKKLLMDILYTWRKLQLEQVQIKILKTTDMLLNSTTENDSDGITTLFEIYDSAQKMIKNIVNDTVLSNNVTLGITSILNISISIVSLLSQTKNLFP